jgi:hypothetical protein
MTSSEYPSNSKTPRRDDEKKVEQVVTGEVTSRKKSLGRRFKETFIGGDSKSVVNYIVMDVVLPQVKELITEAASQGIERLIYGDNNRRRGSRPTIGGGPTNYSRYAVRGNNPIGRSGREDRQPTAEPRGHSIDEITLATRVEAETVLDRLYDLLREYDSASVSDLYSLIGWSSSFVDQDWGWLDLQGSGVRRVRSGYALELPRPVSLK